MSEELKNQSRIHDLFSALLGAFAAFCLITSPWNVDTEGPDPFYKGPLIFPIMVLTMMIFASLPSCKRLLFPTEGSTWYLDGEGHHQKTMVVLILLIAMLTCLNVIGLEISALIFLSVSLYTLGHRGPLKLVVLPIVVTGLVVLIFKYFLGVFFSTPLVVDWLGD